MVGPTALAAEIKIFKDLLIKIEKENLCPAANKSLMNTSLSGAWAGEKGGEKRETSKA